MPATVPVTRLKLLIGGPLLPYVNAHGQTDIQTSAQAAEALRPLAGRFAFTIFALGIIGTGLLALPGLLAQPPLRWVRHCNGRSDWQDDPSRPKRSTAPSHWRR